MVKDFNATFTKIPYSPKCSLKYIIFKAIKKSAVFYIEIKIFKIMTMLEASNEKKNLSRSTNRQTYQV